MKNGTFYLKYTHSGGAADNTFAFGAASGKPVAGHWTGAILPAPGIVVNGPTTVPQRTVAPAKPTTTPNGGGLFD